MIKSMIAVLVLGVLQGCASRPALTPDGYRNFTTAGWIVHQCGLSGMISPETAALARTYLSSSLGMYAYHPNAMDYYVSLIEKEQPPVTQTQCNELAISVAKRQIDQANQQQLNQTSQNNSRPTSTYCNRIGTQVFCQSY